MARAMPPYLLPTPYRGLDCQEGNGAASKIGVYMSSLFVTMQTALDDLDEGEKATLAHESDGHAPFVDSGSHRPHYFAFSSYHNLNPIPATPTRTLRIDFVSKKYLVLLALTVTLTVGLSYVGSCNVWTRSRQGMQH